MFLCLPILLILFHFKHADSMNTINKVLIIDDDETTCFLSKLFLENFLSTEEIECFQDAEEALELVKGAYLQNSFNESGPDLIFLDINMPGMDGFEFLEKVRKLEGIGEICSRRVVMYTSSKHHKDLEKANRLGVLAYVQKPLTEDKMKYVLEAYSYQNT